LRLRAAHIVAFALVLAVACAAVFPASAAGPGSLPPNTGAPTPAPAPTPSGQPGAPSQANPFPSPTPTGTPGPIGNGFFSFGYNGGNGSGGLIPSTVATSSPFPGSSANGFFVNVAGRFSSTFTAMLHFDSYSLHGGDLPVVTRSDGALYYTPRGGVFAAGVGYASLQRSSNRDAANALGLGASLLPNFRQVVSPYVNVFYYPSATAVGASAAITTFQAGVMVRPRSSRVLIELGYDHMSYPNQNSSPTTLGGFQAGLGANF
jgi:hypothetical protein